MQSQLTPLYERHISGHGKMVDFAGYMLPVQFEGITKEHLAVRNAVGLFDVSHMARLKVEGEGAPKLLQRLCTNDITGMEHGRCRYTFICNENGGVLDDVIVSRLNDNTFYMVPNASNHQRIVNHINANLTPGVLLEDLTSATAQIALQGPNAKNLLESVVENNSIPQRYYSFVMDAIIAKKRVVISQTGYTGEHGYELYFSADDAESVYDSIVQSGSDFQLQLCGLGARDTLRMEACLPLYGHELAEDITPVESGFAMFVRKNDFDFIGGDVLQHQLQEGAPKKRIGIEMTDRGIPRQGYELYAKDAIIGQVTSGGFCPSLNGNYAMASVRSDADLADLSVLIRDKQIKATQTAMPFYKRSK